MLRSIRDSLVSVIYPQQCRVCSGTIRSVDDGNACHSCWNETRIFNGSEMLCSKCGAFFSREAAGPAVRCHKCDPHHYDRAFAIGIYEKALSAAIISLKSEPHIAARLRSLIAAAFAASLTAYDVLVPVPLSRLRQAERGFNQAGLVAREISRTCRVRTDDLSLTRIAQTPMHRAGMDDRARELTVQKAFEVTRPKLIREKRVLLVDDVFTSGATTSACAKVLKKAGADSVDVFTLARAVMK